MFQLPNLVSNNKPQPKGLVTNQKSSLPTEKENSSIDRNTIKKTCMLHLTCYA